MGFVAGVLVTLFVVGIIAVIAYIWIIIKMMDMMP